MDASEAKEGAWKITSPEKGRVDGAPKALFSHDRRPHDINDQYA